MIGTESDSNAICGFANKALDKISAGTPGFSKQDIGNCYILFIYNHG